MGSDAPKKKRRRRSPQLPRRRRGSKREPRPREGAGHVGAGPFRLDDIDVATTAANTKTKPRPAFYVARDGVFAALVVTGPRTVRIDEIELPAGVSWPDGTGEARLISKHTVKVTDSVSPLLEHLAATGWIRWRDVIMTDAMIRGKVPIGGFSPAEQEIHALVCAVAAELHAARKDFDA